MAAPRKKDIPLEFRNARKGGDAEEWMIDQFGMYWNQPCMKQMPNLGGAEAMLKGVCIMVPPFAVMGLLMLFVMCLAAREKKSKQKALDAKKPDAKKPDAKKPEQSKEKRSKKTD